MDPARERQLSDLYHAALARPSEERAAFLKDACPADERLRAEVESLLRYEPAAERFLETPAAAAAANAQPMKLPHDFGPYTLTALLGAGGMGEVYRARDLKLGREVAIKILPVHLTADTERAARFAREARLLATLNHPHIGAIYGLHEENGTTAIVLELVEGSTLADRLERGPLPIADALTIAQQIAEALETAHEKGIVHRDLKPANIVLQGGAVTSSDLRAKVLDFGLGKAIAPGPADAATMADSFDGTVDGRILGTPAYMSPEQARGLPVDKRTDIWAFGCVLFEMLSGRRPFSGDTVTDVMAAVVTNDPDWRGLPRDTPQRIRLLLARCLQKDPKLRLRDIGDARLELAPLDEAALGIAPAARSAEHKQTTSRFAWLAIAGLVLAIAGGVWWIGRDAPTSASPAAASAPVDRPLSRLTFDPGLQSDATFSPDGRSIAYASNRAGNSDIWVQSLDGGQPRQLTNSPAAETQPAWSPDGTRIVFKSDDGTGGLFRIPAHGGPATQLTSFGMLPVWSADGTEILFRTGIFPRAHAVYTVSPDGGAAPRELAAVFLRQAIWAWVAPHPDGRISAIGLHPERGRGFYTVSRDGSHVVASTIPPDLPLDLVGLERGSRFQWNAKGTALYLEALYHGVRSIWRVRVNPDTLAWAAADRLTTGSGADVSAVLSRDGTRLAFTVEQEIVRLWAYPLEANAGRITGPGVPITPEDGRSRASALSPDGRYVAYLMLRTGSNASNLLLTDIDAGITETIAANASAAAWSPDSGTLAYLVPRGDNPLTTERALVARPLGRSETIIRTWNKESFLFPSGWTPDGQFVLGTYNIPGSAVRAKAASWPAASSAAPEHRILLEDPAKALWQVGMSPNGQWLAFVAGLTDRPFIEMHIARPRASASEWIRVAADHPWPDKPRWSPDGKLLYFISNQGSSFFNLWAVRFDPDRGEVVEAPFRLTRFDSAAEIMAPDVYTSQIGIGKGRAVLEIATVRGNIWLLENVDR
jgi:Tol biopolymer transport system component